MHQGGDLGPKEVPMVVYGEQKPKEIKMHFLGE